MFRKGIRENFKEQFDRAEFVESETLPAFRSAHPDYAPDLVVLGQGTHLPEYDRLKAGYIKNLHRGTGLIAVSKAWDIKTIKRCIKTSVKGYLLECSSLDDWAECVRNVLSKKRYIPKIVLEEVLNDYIYKDPDITRKIPHLSRRELEIAQLLKKGTTVSEIAESLGRKVSSISTSKARMFKKLNIFSLVELKEALESYKDVNRPYSR